MSMTYDDYINDTRNNAIDAIQDNYDLSKTFDEIFDQLQMDDSVTGNASGSFTFSTLQAQENLTDLIWDEDITELFINYGYDGIPIDRGAETVDVMLRCIALDELYTELEEEYDELVKERTKWLCPYCTDSDGNNVMLTKNDDNSYTCPECGCTTSSPEDDACLKF